jgi:hypothetical protein
MRRILSALIYSLLISLFAFAGHGQEATVEPTPPSEVTAEPTSESTLEATSPVETAPATTPAATPTATASATDMPDVAATEQRIPADQQAHYRIAHSVPDAASLNVEVDGEPSITELAFPAVGEWQTVTAGTYPFSIVPEGDANAAPIVQFESTLETGTWRTIALIGSLSNGTVTAFEIVEDYSELNPGTGGLTLFYGIEGETMVNLNRNTIPFVTELTFPGVVQGGASFATLHEDAGVFDFQVVATQDPSNIVADLPQNEISENAYTFIAVIGTPDHPQALVDVTDRSEVNMEMGTLPRPGTLLEAAASDENLTTLAQVIVTSGLAEELRGEGPFTIFAPANFVLDTLDVSDPAELAAILRYHIVEGKVLSRGVTSAQTLNTLAGQPITVGIQGNNIYINEAQVIALNIPAANGVIHIINGVLRPPGGE